MKKNFVLIAALVAALTVAFVSCDDGYGSTVSGTGETTPAVSLFDLAEGISDEDVIGVEGSAVFADGVISFAHVGNSAYDDGSIFTVAAEGAVTESTITITYICKVLSGDPKVTLKNGSWSTDAGPSAIEGGIYQTLKAGEEATLVIKGSGYSSIPKTDISDKLWFQRNGDTNAFLIKILDVKVE